MKRIIRTVALFATIGMVATGCQKDMDIPTQGIVSQISQVHKMHYSVDGVFFTESLYGEDELRDFLQRMFVLVRNGHEVVVFDSTKTSDTISAKEVVTFTTTSEEEANNWAHKMIGLGYIVHITEKDGVYTCTAVK